MADKTIVFITGANTGIGYEAVKALLQSPKAYHVLLGSRSVEKGKEAVSQVTKEYPDTKSTVELVQIDISDDASIHEAVATIKGKFDRLDCLVNNAGASFDTTFANDESRFRQIFNQAWDTNVAGTQVLTYACVPLLLAAQAPRLIFLTSGLSTLEGASKALHPFRPNPAAGWPKKDVFAAVGYRSSKAGLNMTMLIWHNILQEDGVKVFCISPGFLATGLGGVGPEALKAMGAGEAWLGGDIIKRVVDGERDADAGKVVAQNGVVQPW
ncbi:hypothetical protein B0I35DRAFT_431263 [Stachybotrys elegans]|uniref:NAD(P)-binding protein n=1 Tax=Stachybotrys elegans TaxID=80388 RepID=A0A8K0SUI8_9HYPO|nr:hypothetical protein B0I35DRAFT_431263 [Stachybotrys elegans]